MEGTVRVKGLRELTRDLNRLSKEVSKEVRDELKEAGDIVRTEASSRFASISPRSAAGYRTRVRRAGLVVVEQSRRRVTGRRGDYGALQMRRALAPAVASKEGEVVNRIDRMLERLGNSNGF